MLASTVQFSNNTPTQTRISGPAPSKKAGISEDLSGSYFLPGKNVCSFRTQQCVDISTAGRSLSTGRYAGEVVSVPPMSSSRTTCESETVSARGDLDCSRHHLEKCSLERR